MIKPMKRFWILALILSLASVFTATARAQQDDIIKPPALSSMPAALAPEATDAAPTQKHKWTRPFVPPEPSTVNNTPSLDSE